MKKIILVPFHKINPEKIILDETGRLGLSSFEKCLWLVPSVRRIRKIQKALADTIEKESFVPPGLFTIDTFAKELFLSFDNRILIDNVSRLLILHRLLNRIKDKLSPLMPAGNPYFFSGILKSVARWIKNLKDYIIPSIGLEGAITLLGSKASQYQIPEDVWQKCLRVIDVFKEYEQLLNEKGLLDEEDLILNLPSLIQKTAKPELVIIDGFYNLTNAEKRAFEAIIQYSKNCLAICFGSEAGKESSPSSKSFIEFLKKNGFEQALFTEKKREIKREIIEYSSPEGEVEGIATGIKTLCLKERVDPSDIAVTFPSLSKYELTIKRVFKKYGIDFFINTPVSFLNTPSVMPAIKCLKAIDDDFPRRLFASVLRSPYFKKIPYEIKFSAENISIKAGIIKGRDEWISSLETLKKEILRKEKDGEESIDPQPEKLIERTINFLNDFFSIAKRLKEENGHTFEEYKDIMEELFEFLEWSSLESSGEVFQEEEKEIREFKNLLEGFVIAEEIIGREKIDFSSFLKLLQILLNAKSFLPERKEAGVEILNISDAGNISPSVLFFGGLIEGEYPQKPAKDLILPERLKKELSLLTIDEFLELERFDFEKLLDLPKKQIILSYPSSEADKLYLPSSFLMDIIQEPPRKVLDFSYEILKEEVYSYEEFLRIRGLVEGKIFQGANVSGELNFQGPLLDLILTRYGNNAVFFPTELEVYARCPHLFYLQKILKLEEVSEPTEEWDPGTWGKAVHRVLYRFFKKGFYLKNSLREFKEGIANAISEVSKEELFNPFMQEMLLSYLDSVSEFLFEQEREFRINGYCPLEMEKMLKGELEKGTMVAGRIDRLDSNGKDLRIIDYKTGKSPALKEIKEGTHLQMPLYHLLAKKNFPGFSVEEAGILNLKEKEWKEYFKKNKEHFEGAKGKATEYVANIREGKFPRNPPEEDDICDGSFSKCTFFALGACEGGKNRR